MNITRSTLLPAERARCHLQDAARWIRAASRSLDDAAYASKPIEDALNAIKAVQFIDEGLAAEIEKLINV